ncbi:MAG: peptide ABC transporter substrate-binding protein [Acidimicrobiales bacterium]
MKGAGRRVVVVVTLLVAVACSSSDNRGGRDGTPIVGGTLVDYQNWASGPADGIDPALAGTLEAQQPGQLLFDGLTDYDYKTGTLEPAVAEKWSSNADATVWTFVLRPGVTFSNGDPVLPSDFKFAWERAASRALGSPMAYHLTDNARIKGAGAVNTGTAAEMSGVKADNAASTLTVELEAPLSFFPAVVAHIVFSPVPQKLVQALPDQTKWQQGIMIGNGPYKMSGVWKPEEGLRLTRNQTYWGGIHNHPAYIETIDFKVSKDVDAAWAAFESGQGLTGRIPPARYAEARSQYPGRVATQAANGLYQWSFNMKDPVVGGPQNVKLRQAISLAVDRDRIVRDVFNGSRLVATGITPPGILGYRPGIARYASLDLTRAKQLLGEWEQATGKKAADLPTIKLNFGAGAGHEPVATIIQQNLRDLGIRSDLDPLESRTYPAAMRRGEGQFFRVGWIADYNAYDNMLWPLFSARSTDNLTQWANPRFDGLIDAARSTIEDGRRYDNYQQAESVVLNDDTVIVPITWFAGTIAWSAQLHSVTQSPLLFVAYDEMWLSS